MLRIIILQILALMTINAHAGFSNYNSILPGDKSAGMGGAATALVGDVSSASFYNPATLAELEGSAFSAAVGIYKKYDTVYGKEEDYTKAPLRANIGFFRSLPASSGSMIRFGDYVACLSIVVPDYDNFKGDLKNTAEGVSTLSYVDESLWVGGSVAKKLDEQSSLGFTLYYTARNYTRSAQDRSYVGTDSKVFTSEKAIIQNALVPIVGYFYNYSNDLKLGVSLRIPAFPIQGTGSLYETYSDSAVSGSTTNVSLDALSSPIQIPGKLTFGWAYLYDPTLQLTGDLSVYEATSYPDLVTTSGSFITYQHRQIANGSLGLEKSLTEWFKVRFGVFTNFSAHPDVDAVKNQEQPDKVDQLGFSANVIYIKDKKIGYTFGGYYSGGRGKSAQRIDQQYQVVTKTQHVFTMLVGTNFFF